MTDKKTIKQLMAIGCQRNDAAAFARAYRKIKAAKCEDLFPGIVEPVMPVRIVKERVDVQEIWATAVIPADQVRFYTYTGDFAERLFEKLVGELARGLAKSGAIKIERRDWPPRRDVEEYAASIKVVMPGKGSEYV